MLDIVFYIFYVCLLYVIFKYYGLSGYGFMIAVGLNLYQKLLKKDPFINTPQLNNLVTGICIWGIFVGLVSARILWFLEYYNEVTWYDFITIKVPGFSLLGALVGVIFTLLYFVRNQLYKTKILIIDRMFLYAPLLIAFGRIGCYMVGCCYGTPTNLPWSICYTDPNSLAPCGVNLHPVQLYSAFSLLLIFIVFYVKYRKKDGHGTIFLHVLLAIVSERFVTDFFRDDRTLCLGILSLHQVIAIIIAVIAIVGWYKIKKA